MSSSLSTQTFFASRCMRAMALFAWLLLTVSLPATSMGGTDGMSQDSQGAEMASMMHDGMNHGAPTSLHHAGDCCGNPSHAACQCDAMCGSVLLPVVSALSGSAMLADAYAPLRGIDAPTLDPVPPLRPPAA
jgi:hypothetical protein